MAASEDRRDRAGGPVDRGGEGAGGAAQTEFPLRQRELQALLGEVDKALRRCGLALRRHRLKDGSDVGVSVIEPLAAVEEQQAQDQRAGVREVTGVMFSRLAMRLESLGCTFARLSEQERTSVAALLRLPERDRVAIATLLRLPEQEREELSIGFRLSERECGALADLLEPSAPVAEAGGRARPTIAIVDPGAEVDRVAALPTETSG
jgi:hypothetical protein